MRLDIRIDRAFASTKTSSMPIALLIASPTQTIKQNCFGVFSWPAAALCTSRYSAFLYFTAGRTQSESVDGCAGFILYLNALSIVETKIEQQALTFWSGYTVPERKSLDFDGRSFYTPYLDDSLAAELVLCLAA